METTTLSILAQLTAENNHEQEDAVISPCLHSKSNRPSHPKPTSDNTPEIFRAKRSGGGEMRMLKTVLTTACERNCYYCAFRAGRDFRRGTLKPDDMAQLFSNLFNSGIAEGLFLSSGVLGGSIKTQDKILDTAEILRGKLGYTGYLHLKIMPGADKDQVLRTMQLADRVSVNLEAPNSSRLKMLAPLKQFNEELLTPLRWAQEIRRTINPLSSWKLHWPSLATQFVVGGVGENDIELLQLSQFLHQSLNLTRIYYSRFDPIENTPFENLPPENPLRQLRLYQAAFLLRDYGYSLSDFTFNSSQHLPLDIDPKLAWARSNLTETRVEINNADRMQLLRVPGIGPLSVKRISKARNRHTIKEIGELKALGIRVERALPFILLNGIVPDQQPGLW